MKSGKPKTLVRGFKVDTHVELNNREKVGGSSLQTKPEATRTVPLGEPYVLFGTRKTHLYFWVIVNTTETGQEELGGSDVLAGYMTTWSREDESKCNYI
jgi:hypothetical protein